MNSGLVYLARYTAHILQHPAGTVVQIGKENFRRNDFNALQIVIEHNGPAERLNRSIDYNGDTEVMKHSHQFRLPCLINFYGDTAYTQAEKFVLMSTTQTAYEFQRDNQFSVYQTQTIEDVGFLTGDQYSERYELAVNIQYVANLSENILRIDTAQFTIINN